MAFGDEDQAYPAADVLNDLLNQVGVLRQASNALHTSSTFFFLRDFVETTLPLRSRFPPGHALACQADACLLDFATNGCVATWTLRRSPFYRSLPCMGYWTNALDRRIDA